MSSLKCLTSCLASCLLTTAAAGVDLERRATNCGFGLFAWCFWQANPSAGPERPWRVEAFSGYKPGMRYYKDEADACAGKPGCDFTADGAVYGADIYRTVSGNNRGTDYVDVGLQYSRMPVAAWRSEAGFQGSLGTDIAAGSGELRYHFVRLAVKRSHFLYAIRSKYLISAFGVGVGIPEAAGTGEDFVGASRIVPSIGGKLGFQVPVAEWADIGIGSNWNVLWYGGSMGDAAFLAGYGVNLSARI